MDKYQQIIVDYANNRKALGAINKEIKALAWGEPGKQQDINLSGFREDWIGEPGEYGETVRWEGWVIAVGAFDHKPEEMALAKLLDAKKEIIREAGQLKRNMCAYGRGLIANG